MLMTPAIARKFEAATDRNQYLIQVVRWQLARARKQWRRYQGSRNRNAVYLYLEAVFGLVKSWNHNADKCATLAPDLQGHPTPRRVEPFDVVIRCTSDPAKVDARTRSKWSRALRYAEGSKKPSVSLGEFIRARGGINSCAAFWSKGCRQR
jgi:hypothetical protein